MKMMKKLTALILLAALLAACARAEAPCPPIETDVAVISKYGNLILNLRASSLFDQGYEYGDLLTVTIGGRETVMPLASNYTDVDVGDMVCRAVLTDETDEVQLAVCVGDLATSLELAVKTDIDEEPGFRWDTEEPGPIPVTVALLEKGGYLGEFTVRQLNRSNERADYPDLTDEEYANFRAVTTTGMGPGALYRSSSPVNPGLNRSHEADEALNAAGVQTIVNLADTEETMKSYEDYPVSYYSQRQVIALSLTPGFVSDEFRAKFGEGIRFMAGHEGPYLVHCTEGKDRAGFTSAVLECLMGATADEVVADYMVTFHNYYGVEKGTEAYDTIARGNILKILQAAFGVEDLYAADLVKGAEDYLASCGVDEPTIAALKERLGASYFD